VFDLTQRVALVTGAGQGVGAGISRQLARQGAAVAVNDLHAERAQATVRAIEAAGGRACSVVFDVGDYEAVVAGVAEAARVLGPVGILVNNAGIPAGMGLRPFRETQPADWRPYIDVNLYGVMNCCRAVIDGMCERGFGRIVTISSGAGTMGLAIGVSPYAAGKGGGIAFMRHLALETAARGVTANTVALGLVAAPGDPARMESLARSLPVRRLGSPDEIGALCVYLASDEAGWMTGQTLELNGGARTT
jgi:NAD(P)-dependent dehydrogenase (short-subunit alcohol dehydrogenase family)